MSYIVPSGKNKPQWVPSPKATKTASATATGEVKAEPEVEENIYFAAIKDLKSVKEAQSLQESVQEAKEALDKVEVAVETIQQAVAPAVGALGAPSGVPGAAEALGVGAPGAPGELGAPGAPESPLGSPEPSPSEALGGSPVVDEVEIELSPEAPADGVAKDGDEKKETAIPGLKSEEPKSEEPKSEEPKSEPKEEKEASSDEPKFVRLAKISPENRKDLRDYWANKLGFPKEYVDAMVADYE